MRRGDCTCGAEGMQQENVQNTIISPRSVGSERACMPFIYIKNTSNYNIIISTIYSILDQIHIDTDMLFESFQYILNILMEFYYIIS